MNMETMSEYIRYFSQEIINSGFKRDIDDYLSSLPSHQTDILNLREIATHVLNALEGIYEGDLPDAMRFLLPTEPERLFTETPHNETLREIIENTQTKLPEFFSQLQECLTQLKSQIDDNQSALNEIQEFIAPYISKEVSRIAKENVAILSIVFKEQKTITSLKQFAITLTTWNKILPIYHQLLISKSPEDIQIIEVQNGSIDLVFNLDVSVALNLADLFKLGFQVFAAYLSYKKMVKPLLESYHGNKKLISLEEQKEKLMLENIGEAVHGEIMAQHKKAKKADNKVDDTAIQKKVEQVAKLFTSHIVKGNDVKLLALPESAEPDTGQENRPTKREALRKKSMEARHLLKLIPAEEKQKLLEAYGKVDEDSE